jgi:hypothetical protein
MPRICSRTDEQRVIDRAAGRGELADRHAEARAKVRLPARLHQPAGLGQLIVDCHPRAVFGMENRLPRDRAPTCWLSRLRCMNQIRTILPISVAAIG